MEGGVKHSYKVAVGTVKTVFHGHVHMLTALRLWSCILTAALDKPKSQRLCHFMYRTERKSGLDWSLKLSDEQFRRMTTITDSFVWIRSINVYMSPLSTGAVSKSQTTSEHRHQMVTVVGFTDLWTSILTLTKRTACLSSIHISSLNHRRENIVGLRFTGKCFRLFIRLKGQFSHITKTFSHLPQVIWSHASSFGYVFIDL